MIVKSIKIVAEGTVFVLKGASTGLETSIKVTGDGLGDLSLFVGEALTPIVISAGTILQTSTQQVVMFIPNTSAALLFAAREYKG